MSHIAKVKTQIKDLRELQRTCEQLGLVLVPEATVFDYYCGRVATCDGKITAGNIRVGAPAGSSYHTVGHFPNKPYEIGLRRESDGSYALLTDDYCEGMGMTHLAGAKGQKIVQGYARNVARAIALKQGYKVTETKTQTGAILLSCVRA
jgi:hypothetical protein